MVAERICRIPVTDLTTIRVTIKGVATELPLDVEQITKFFTQHHRTNGISQAQLDTVVGLVSDLSDAQSHAANDFRIEFVIPDPAK